MLEMRRGNDHCVHQTGAHQFFAIDKCLERLVFLQFVGHRVRNGNQLGSADLARGQIGGVVLTDVPQPDDP